MNTFASIAPSLGPLPIIHRQYRSIAVSPRGRLSARAETDGTLCLQFYPRSDRSGRRTTSGWRAGPVRTCHLVFEALNHGLALLGEQPSRERSLQLGRLIDAPLAQKLSHYAWLNDGEYERLMPHVSFMEPPRGRPDSSLPPSLAWLAASIVGTRRSTREGGERSRDVAERETFVLVRQHKRWELWARLERANSGSMPCRRHELLCVTELLGGEPALAAELLLYAMLTRRGRAIELSGRPSGLIAPERLALVEHQARTAGGRHSSELVNA